MNFHHQAGPVLATLAATALLAACGGGGVDAPTATVNAAPQVRAAAATVTPPPLQAAPAGLSGNVNCSNLRIGAIVVDNVVVPPGQACSLTGTQVRGSVQVENGGILMADGAVQVAGSVQGSNAAHVQVTGATSRVAGNFEMEGGGSATLADAQVGGNVFVNGIRDLFSIKNTRVAGGMQVTDNLGGGEISGNRVTGNLQCTGNLPGPIAGANTAALIEGQCAPGSSGGGGGGQPPLSGNVTCVNMTLGMVNLDSVIVPAGASCTLAGTVLNGSLQVGAAARVNATSVNVTGGLVAEAAQSLQLTGESRFGGSIQLKGGGQTLLSGATITGDLQIDNMQGSVVAQNNNLTGNLQAMANRGGLSFNGNRMGGVMQCKDNLPAPTGNGNVASLKQDQCLGL